MKRPENKPLFAKRSLGQNFLTDSSYTDKIVDATGPSAGDTIVEIGPGHGALTEKLVNSGASVVAVELDRELVPFLRTKFSGQSNFRVVELNALDVDFGQLLGRNQTSASADRAKLVANLPYYISTVILQRLSEQRHLFSELVLMFQREVVERITAEPGNSQRGFLTVVAEASFDVEKLFGVPPTAFRPVPKVWSAVVRLIPKPQPSFDETAFRNIVSTAFGQKRKTILNNLKTSFSEAEQCLKDAGIDTKRRAESLTLNEWVMLTERLSAAKPQN